MSKEVDEKSDKMVRIALDKLTQIIRRLSPLSIAVSGGVDSMTLAFIANRVTPGVFIFHALSPAVPQSATKRLQFYAEKEAWNLEIVNAKEIEDPDYISNPVNRCYFCKSNLYKTISRYTSVNIASGTNLDDLDDYRPGLDAANEYSVYHPFVEAGIDKAMIRKLAGLFSLSDLQELPASPCLSSRVSTGLVIDAQLLPLIDQVETKVSSLLKRKINLSAVRCRIRKDEIAIELDTDTKLDTHFPYIESIKTAVDDVFSASGFTHYSQNISIEPYQKGSAFIIAKG